MAKNKAAEEEKNEAIEAIFADLSDKERLFIEDYCKFLSKTHAAKASGYSENTANNAGYVVYNRPRVREAIDKYLRLTAISPDENISLMRRIAQTDISEFFEMTETWKYVTKEVSLNVYIQRCRIEIAQNEDYLLMEALKPAEETATLVRNRKLLRQIKTYEQELKINPNAFKLEEVPEKVFEKVLNINKAVAAKVPIKSVKHKATGIEIEFYSASEAQERIARVYGSFEKDNLQAKPETLAPVINVFNGAPPLASDEKEEN